MCDEQLFKHHIPVLSKFARVHTGDITQHDSIENMARVLLDSHGGPELAVAGLSMGAIVAMEMVRQDPRKITKLALLNTNPYADTQSRSVTRQRQVESVKAGRLKRVLVEEMKPAYLAPESRYNSALLDLIMNMGLSLGDRVFIRRSTALAKRRDYRRVLAAYSRLAPIISGEYDVLCSTSRDG